MLLYRALYRSQKRPRAECWVVRNNAQHRAGCAEQREQVAPCRRPGSVQQRRHSLMSLPTSTGRSIILRLHKILVHFKTLWEPVDVVVKEQKQDDI